MTGSDPVFPQASMDSSRRQKFQGESYTLAGGNGTGFDTKFVFSGAFNIRIALDAKAIFKHRELNSRLLLSIGYETDICVQR